MKRRIPATMATQHPDHANKPYWHTESFISTQFESLEAYLCYSDLGIEEYKWDWEGKLVDESILQRLFSNYFEFFKKKPLGWGGTYLTYRLPNPKVETEFRIGRSLMNLASAASEAKHFNLPSPPLFEVILPMTQTAQEMLAIQLAYRELHQLKHPLYRLEGILTNPRIIPLFEDVPTIINSDQILEKYLKLHKKKFKKYPLYMRPYLARSDPALNFGLVPTVIAIKIALSRYKKLEKKINLPLFPIIGAAVLPFRGGLNPLNVERFAKEYQGIKTTTIQSAFRYDFEKEAVKIAIQKLNKLLPSRKALEISPAEEKELITIIPIFEKYYREVVEQISPIINQLASFLPKRRERVQHIGLYGYSRGVGKVKLPRAIGFTASFYSIGIPPEFIGTGRGLKQAARQNHLNLIKKYYKFIKEDLSEAGRFLNKQNLIKLSKISKNWRLILEDVKNIEEIFEMDLGAKTLEERQHQKLTSKILTSIKKSKDPSKEILKAALIRKSLG
ncbi:phosphoenolpyruvate carboxylase [Candidatus Daviesbacteria bacterium]|nr:phosphoenolpyruvate carboxylase [Candidatus Daviesbacteria bacterium]